MTELIRFPAVVGAFRDELNPFLASRPGFTDVEAFGQIPTPRPQRFVLIQRAGGGQIDLVTIEPIVLVESWGRSDSDAENLAEEVHAGLLAAGRAGWLGGVPLRRMGVAGLPQSLPDPESKQRRYTATYTPRLRGAVVP